VCGWPPLTAWPASAWGLTPTFPVAWPPARCGHPDGMRVQASGAGVRGEDEDSGMGDGMKRIRDVLRKFFPVDLYVRALPYMRSHKLAMAVVVLLLTAEPVLTLLSPWPMKILVDNGLVGKALPDWVTQALPYLAPDHRHTIVVFAILAMIVLGLIGTVLGHVRSYLKTRVNDSMTQRFQADLFRHLLGLSFRYHDRKTV